VSENSSAEFVIVGSGIAGLLVARELLAAGREVLMLERGGLKPHAQQLADGVHEVELPTTEPNHEPAPGTQDYPWAYVYGVGGTTMHWTGATPRLLPEDFELKSRYGVGRDWPFGYREMDPWYEEAEAALAVAGGHNPLIPRRKPLPLPAHPYSPADKLLAAAVPQFYSFPQARPTRPVDGRPACCGSARCDLCPVDARFSALQVYEREIKGKPGFTLRDRTLVSRLRTSAGRVTGLDCVTSDGKRFSLPARNVVLCANGIETAAILMRSDLGGGDVGRYLYDHDEVVLEFGLDRPAGAGIGTTLSTGWTYEYGTGDFRSKRAAFLITPYNPGTGMEELIAQGLVDGKRGKSLRAELQRHFERTLILVASGDELPQRDRFVTLSPTKDSLGIPLNRVHYAGPTAYYNAGLQAVREGLTRQLARYGAKLRPPGGSARGGHLIGTCRMGERDGVVDPQLRHHDLANLHVAGSSAFPSYSAAHPTLTLSALAIRLGRHLAGEARQ
jgi:choline dehydrogenase-like flavoprotein